MTAKIIVDGTSMLINDVKTMQMISHPFEDTEKGPVPVPPRVVIDGQYNIEFAKGDGDNLLEQFNKMQACDQCIVLDTLKNEIFSY